MPTLGPFSSLAQFRDALAHLPPADEAARSAALAHQAQLTKPAGSLGKLEDCVAWLAAWQGRHPPAIARAQAIVFAGNHGVTTRGVSAYPASVTAQMVANFAAGGAAINQLARWADATLTVVPLALDTPTADLTVAPAMSEAESLAAIETGMSAVSPGTDILVLGEMGIGNTTSAAALAAALFGGNGAAWAGPGTGVGPEGVSRKAAAIDAALSHHGASLGDPIEALRRVGGRELAAIAGAVYAARIQRVPVLLDGFVCTAAAAPLKRADPGALDHCLIGHTSAEPGHRRLLAALGMSALLDLGMRLGEGTGAALALGVVRAALAAHTGMATFGEAGVSGQSADTG